MWYPSFHCMSRRSVHNITTRRNCLKALSEGTRQLHIAQRYQLDSSTIFRWAQSIGLKRGDNIGEEELDRRLQELAERERAEAVTPHKKDVLNRKYGVPKPPKPPPANPYGPRKPKEPVPSVLEPLLVSDEVTPEDYERAIQQFTEQIAVEMGQETTIEGQIKQLTGGLLLEQLRLLKGNLPPVATWADVERVIKLTRLNFGMDDAAKGMKRVDLTLLNGKLPVVKGKVVDAEVVKPRKLKEPVEDFKEEPESEDADEADEFEI